MKFNECASVLVENSVTIFLLHGVIRNDNWQFRNFNRKHIFENEFREFLNALLEVGEAVSMDAVIEYSNGKSSPKNAFAITFDDGFENNLSIAAPILKELLVPATFYITTNFVDNNLMSWADRIDWAIEVCRCQNELRLSLPWQHKIWYLRAAADKLKFLKEVRHHVKNNPSIDHDKLADQIQLQLNLPLTYSSDDELDLKLTWDGVKELNQSEYFTIGGHTHSHPIMSFIDEAELSSEINTCLSLLKSHADVTTTHFAYPEGLAQCYNDKVIDCLKSYGIKCCPTAEPGVNNILTGTDLFRLKRVFVE